MIAARDVARTTDPLERMRAASGRRHIVVPEAGRVEEVCAMSATETTVTVDRAPLLLLIDAFNLFLREMDRTLAADVPHPHPARSSRQSTPQGRHLRLVEPDVEADQGTPGPHA